MKEIQSAAAGFKLMKNIKILLCAAALLLSVASNASAITIDVTSMILGSSNNDATGALTSIDSGSSFDPYGTSTGIFFFQPWYAGAIEYFDDASGTILHFDGDDVVLGVFDYVFTLSEGQHAWGMWLNFGGSSEIPVLNIMDCGAGNPGAACIGIGTPMQSGPFIGHEFSLSGMVINAVPVPAAAWLFCSGLLTLLGITHRKSFFYYMNLKRKPAL